MKTRPVQMNFTGGEWSPRLHSRMDLAKYWNALETLENFIILPQGGVTRRPGWHFVAEVSDSTKFTRLIPFIFSTVQAYILEAGENYLRFYKDHGRIAVTGASETDFNPAAAYLIGPHAKIGPYRARDFGTSKFLYVAAPYGQTGATSISVAVTTAGADTLAVSAAGATITIALADTTPAKNKASLIQAALRALGTVFGVSVAAYTVTENAAYAAARPTAGVSIAAAALAGGNKIFQCLTAIPAVADNTSFFPGIDAAYWVEVTAGDPCDIATAYTEAELPTINHAQSADMMWLVHGDHPPANLSRTGHTSWNIADISFTSMPDWDPTKGYPQACCFHEQRFCYAGSKQYPQVLWASKSGSFNDFSVASPVADDDACTFYLVGDTVDGIYWLASSKALFAGTAAGEIRIFGGESGITPTAIDSKNENFERCHPTAPIRVGNVILFVQKYARKLRELAYVFTDDAFHAPDLSLLAEHITLGGIEYIAYQQEPHSLVWAVRSDGVGLSLSYKREEEIVGWARQITDGEIESIAVIPDPTGSFDEVWAVIKRTIGGVDKRYIEYLDEDMMVDSGLTYSGVPVSSVSGLSHLEGETVDIVGDGFVYPQAVVTGGSVTLAGPAASEIQVGLNYVSKLVTMRPNIQLGAGTTAGLPKKWAELYISLLESSGLVVNDETIPFREVGDPIGEATDPFTGEKSVSQLGWGDGRVTIEQRQPLPCTIRAIYGELEIG